MFYKLFNTTSALALSALLLGAAFTTTSQAMEEGTTPVRAHQVPILKAYADLANNPASNIPPIKPGDLLLIDVGHGLVHSSEWVTKRATGNSLFEKHETFMGIIKELNEKDHENLTKKIRLASRNEFVKVGEKGLPTLLDTFSDSGINIIPISSRCDDGACSSDENPDILSRTEQEFVNVGYNYKNWKKPAPLKDPTIIVELQDPNAPEAYGN